MIEVNLANSFKSIKHRSIESATNTNLLIYISNIKILPKLFIMLGIVFTLTGRFICLINILIIPYIGYFFITLGIIFLIGGVYLVITLKYKFEFSFKGQKLILKSSGFFFTNSQQYFISQLDYIIIDQMYVENDDDEGKGISVSIGDEQNGIQSKIIINSIDDGLEEIFNGSGDPPLFTNDEVQFFNQFMKANINRIKS